MAHLTYNSQDKREINKLLWGLAVLNYKISRNVYICIFFKGFGEIVISYQEYHVT